MTTQTDREVFEEIATLSEQSHMEKGLEKALSAALEKFGVEDVEEYDKDESILESVVKNLRMVSAENGDSIDAMSTGVQPFNNAREVADLIYNTSKRYRGNNPAESRPQGHGQHVEPRFLYFYYIRLNENKSFETCVYEFFDNQIVEPGPVDDQKKSQQTTAIYEPPNKQTCVALAMADVIDNSGSNAVQTHVDDVKWRGPCYLVFWIDAEGWEYLNKSGKNHSMYFLEQDRRNKGKAKRNVTFFGAQTEEFSFGSESHSCLVVQNYNFKGVFGRPQKRAKIRKRRRGDQDDQYKFDIYMRAPIRNDSSGRKVTIIIDPSGRNVGP